MTEDQVIAIMRRHLEGQFPQCCTNCNRPFATLKEYLLGTEQVGSAMPYDEENDDWEPVEPMGTYTFANCTCGSTLALSSNGIPLLNLWSLYHWARVECKKRGVTQRELLNDLRDKICKQVLETEEMETMQVPEYAGPKGGADPQHHHPMGGEVRRLERYGKILVACLIAALIAAAHHVFP